MIDLPVAIITGASRGIGKACAIGLAEMGYKTCLISRNIDALAKVSEEINRQNQTEPITIAYDLDDITAIDMMVDHIKTKYGRIDVLVNNAGRTCNGSLGTTIEEFENIINLNLTAPFALLKAVVPIMKHRKKGHIFNISSRAGKIGFKNKGVYGASKFGLNGLAESLYKELAEDGISVTSICPGWVNTELAQEAQSPLKKEEMIQPEDIMETLRWLLKLSPNTCIKEVVLECFKSIY